MLEPRAAQEKPLWAIPADALAGAARHTVIFLSARDLVLAGVVLSGVFFAAKVARLLGIGTERSADGREITYHVTGQVFFASAKSFVDAFDSRRNA